MEPIRWGRWIALLLGIVLLVGSVVAIFRYYPVIFSQTVDGRVVAVHRATTGEADTFVVAVRGADGKIRSAEGSDPRWALVSVGQCASARFFPAPPWDLELRGSFTRATLLNPRDCLPSDGAMPTPEEADAGLHDNPLDPKVLEAMDIPEPTPEIRKDAGAAKEKVEEAL